MEETLEEIKHGDRIMAWGYFEEPINLKAISAKVHIRGFHLISATYSAKPSGILPAMYPPVRPKWWCNVKRFGKPENDFERITELLADIYWIDHIKPAMRNTKS